MKLIKVIKFTLVIIFTVLWSFTIIAINFQKKSIGEKSVDIPIYLFSYKKNILEKIKSKTENLDCVKKITYSSNNEIVDKLLNKYDLKDVSQYVERNKIPHVLFIEPNQKIFLIDNYDKLFLEIDYFANDIILNFNDEIFSLNQKDYTFFSKSILYVNITFAFLLLLLTIFFHFYDKIELRNFRNIYIASGGNPRNLTINIWSKTISFVIINMLLNFGFVYYISQKLSIDIDLKFLLIQLTVLLFAFIFANSIKDN